MITDHEIQTLELSATKRDFYQIWNELLETASKLSERWDPTSTNESDPGIVLLKVLTAVADKLNYQIDKNTLESFLPTAAQTESVRKLCELVGYDMKYFQSGKTSASIKWVGGVNHTNKTLVDAGDTELVNITLPRFTVLKNTGGDVVYSTTESCDFGYNNRENFVDCIEGAVIPCTTDSGNIVTINLLDDNHRYYLPEAQVAENGIFIYNIAANGEESAEPWKKVSNLNTQPLGSPVYKIGYGSKLGLLYIQFPEDIGTLIEDGLAIYFTRTKGANGNIAAKTLTTLETPKEWAGQTETTSSLNETLFSVSNKNAAMNGMNPETNTQAYNNYKKIIGTFDTLVTCRDYMNKIYQLYDDLDVPVVSNIIVSDIRDDINRTVQLCSFNEYGINYADLPINLNADTLSNFDLIIYPFKTVYGLNTKTEYKNSFTCDFEKNNLIEHGLSKNKTISHNLINPKPNEIACIKNYLKLTAKITTTTKVNAVAQKNILETIYKALYAAFNARQLDFGEDIPFDNILACIQTADSRIKNVSLEEPKIVTKICRVDGGEKFIDEDWGQELYNKLAIRNILAGKVPLFNYNETFKPDLSEKEVAGTSPYTGVQTLKSSCAFPVANLPEDGEKLVANEFIQFRAPNFRTSMTYPAYVNYFAVLNQNGGNPAVAAKFLTLRSFFMTTPTMWLGPTGIITTKFNTFSALAKNSEIDSDSTLADERFKYGEIFIWADGAWQIASTTFISGTDYYYCPLIPTTFSAWYTWVKGLTHDGGTYLGLCSQLLQNMERPLGYLVDDEHYKYKALTQPLSISGTAALDNYYIQDTSVGNTNNFGLGISATIIGIAAGGEYKLGADEYIYFNYTNSSTNAANTDTTVVKNVYYGPGTIIKPNFNLKDSAALKREGKVFTKTIITGTNFVDASGNAGRPLTLPDVDGTTGMFSLGGGEQIEIREPIIVNFSPAIDIPAQTSKNINVYWETASKSKTFSFPDNETAGGHSYTLKEGEYFFYTDVNKTDLVWYGSGTKIYQRGNLELVKAETADEVSIEDILENGLDIIPWVKLTVTEDNYLTVHEYQYITLTTGDALNTIAFPGDAPSTLTNTFVPCTSANYTLGGTTQNLPQITAGPASWEVRSGLMFNVGPTLTQTLQKVRDVITVIDESGSHDVSPSTETELSFKTNYPCQTTAHEVNVSVDSDGKSLIPAFSLELFNKQDIKAVFGSTEIILPLNNFGDLWTKFTFAQLDSTKTKKPTIDLYVKLQGNQYGLLMFYYKPADEDHLAYLTIEDDTHPLVIFNNGSPETWWATQVTEGTPDKYHLKAGLNIVKIPVSHTLTIHKADTNGYGYNDIIIFGKLDIVDVDNDLGINLALLDYQGTGTAAQKATALLNSINEIDPNHLFYYNNVLDNNNVIDLNIASGQTLSSSLSWYDYNNANNKFVISEIDADYLEEGITIARTSKL